MERCMYCGRFAMWAVHKQFTGRMSAPLITCNSHLGKTIKDAAGRDGHELFVIREITKRTAPPEPRKPTEGE